MKNKVLAMGLHLTYTTWVFKSIFPHELPSNSPKPTQNSIIYSHIKVQFKDKYKSATIIQTYGL